MKSIVEKDAEFLVLYLGSGYFVHKLPLKSLDIISRKFVQVTESDKFSQIKPLLLRLWTAILSNEDPMIIYGALCDFLTLLNILDGMHEPITPTKRSSWGESNLVAALQSHWTGEYIGPSRGFLQDKIRKYEDQFSKGQFYSKSLLFVQSSGTGKSRLADAYGEICPMVSYVLRNDEDGFPPGDFAILEAMRSTPTPEVEAQMSSPKSKPDLSGQTRTERVNNIWFHAVAVGILQASFEIYDHRISEWTPSSSNPTGLNEIAMTSHRAMALSHGNRSQQRRSFCNEVATRAIDIANACVSDENFRACFDDTELSGIRTALLTSTCSSMEKLRSAVSKLETTLKLFHRECTNDPVLIVVFDEISSLLDETGRAGRFVALNRIISVISSDHNVWYFFLSTELILDEILPPDNAPRHRPSPDRPSWRGDFRLKRFPPFTQFTVDIPDIKNGLRFTPGRERMTMLTTTKHMAKFGRPLWLAYGRPDDLARVKLIGGNPDRVYDPYDSHHVFAALSVRICLDLNLADPITIPLSQTAVNVHMRMLDSVDPSTGVMFTTTPTEPILANAAMYHLCKRNNWSISIKTFTSELLERGAIDKGMKGELFSRLILTLAHDIIAGAHVTDSSFSAVMPTFTVDGFLRGLFSQRHHEALGRIDIDILQARMNFLLFTSTQECLTAESFQRLCYILLRRSAALQLAPQQKTYDQLLPFYCGDPNEPFDISKVGAILIQVRYRNKPSSPSTIFGKSFFPPEQTDIYLGTRGHSDRKDFQDVIVNDPGVKLLFILFDLGSEENSVEVSYSKASNPTIWAIHSQGHDERVFGCPDAMNATEYMRMFFHNAMPWDETEIAFNHHKDLLINVQQHDRLQLKPSSPTENIFMPSQ